MNIVEQHDTLVKSSTIAAAKPCETTDSPTEEGTPKKSVLELARAKGKALQARRACGMQANACDSNSIKLKEIRETQQLEMIKVSQTVCLAAMIELSKKDSNTLDMNCSSDLKTATFEELCSLVTNEKVPLPPSCNPLFLNPNDEEGARICHDRLRRRLKSLTRTQNRETVCEQAKDRHSELMIKLDEDCVSLSDTLKKSYDYVVATLNKMSLNKSCGDLRRMMMKRQMVAKCKRQLAKGMLDNLKWSCGKISTRMRKRDNV